MSAVKCKPNVARLVILITLTLVVVCAYAAVSNYCSLTVWLIVRWAYIAAGCAMFVLYFITKRKLYLMLFLPILAAFAWELIDLYVIPRLAQLTSQLK